MTFLYWPASTEKRIIYVLAVSTATNVVYNLFKYLTANVQTKTDENPEHDKQVAETHFFSQDCSKCLYHLNNIEPCGLPTCPFLHLNQIIRHISSARKTLDVCVYFFTFHIIAQVLIEAHRRNVIVRVITDGESSDNEASQAFNLYKEGLQVRIKKFAHLMHHKFAIIDGKVLIIGSANWTRQAFFGNYENIIVTNQRKIVDGFSKEYESLWSMISEEFGEQ